MSDIEYRLFDPKEDFVFKALFGTEENKELLISLLDAILKGKPYIKDLSLNNTEITNTDYQRVSNLLYKRMKEIRIKICFLE